MKLNASLALLPRYVLYLLLPFFPFPSLPLPLITPLFKYAYKKKKLNTIIAVVKHFVINKYISTKRTNKVYLGIFFYENE
jgi:hypothetical protein